jgi:hypothetical protein
MGRSYGGRRSQVRIDVRAMRGIVRVVLHIQHRRPNGWADRGPNWYKHSLMRDERSTTNKALPPDGLDRSNPKLVQKVIRAMDTRYRVSVLAACVERARSARRACKQHASSAQRAIGAEQPSCACSREYSDRTGRHNCCEREVRVCGAHAYRAERRANKT